MSFKFVSSMGWRGGASADVEVPMSEPVAVAEAAGGALAVGDASGVAIIERDGRVRQRTTAVGDVRGVARDPDGRLVALQATGALHTINGEGARPYGSVPPVPRIRSLWMRGRNSAIAADTGAWLRADACWSWRSLPNSSSVRGAAVTPDGDLAFVDYLRHVAWIHTRSGETRCLLGEPDRPGRQDGELMFPTSVDATASGSLLITDTGNHRVIEVDTGGKILWTFGRADAPGTGGGRLWWPVSAVRADDGSTLVATPFNDCVTEIWPDGSARCFGTPLTESCIFDNPRSAFVSKSGRVLVADTKHNRVVEVSTDGSVLWEYTGDDVGGLFWPRCAIYGEEDRTVWIADGRNNRVVRVDRETKRIAARELVAASLGDPHDLALRDGHLLVADTANDRVIEMRLDDGCVTYSSDRCGVALSDPHGACYADRGVIAVADTGNDRVVLLDATGVVAECNALSSPRSIARTAMGTFLVADTGSGRVVELSPRLVETGCEIRGMDHPAVSQFRLPRHVSVHGPLVLVTDFGNNRIVTFKRSTMGR